MLKNTLLTWVALSTVTLVQAQNDYGYIPPMDIPMVLSGNFGEMRRNHFHTGIDIKTQGRQGIPIHAIADGYISRIKVSPYGYGNAIYIDHYDGHTSVYAHMRSFSGKLDSAMTHAQYEAKRWAMDYYPEPDMLRVNQGEVIGLSGNSGSSSGPHLHFEIRATGSEHPLNPLSFGYEPTDAAVPEIKGIRVYPLDERSHLAGKRDAESFVARTVRSGEYRLEEKVQANGRLGLAIHTYDRMSNTHNKYGVYRLEMKVDGITVYEHTMDELDFGNFRQVNCHKDYALYHLHRWKYHKCFPAENNTLEIYDILVDGGRISIYEGDEKEVEFITEDIMGNRSTISFTLKGSPALDNSWSVEDGVLLDASTDNVFTLEDIAVRIPHGRIYEDLYLRPSRDDLPNEVSDRFNLHDVDVPIDDYISISLRSRAEKKDEPYLIMEHTDYRGRKSFLKGEFRSGWYTVKNKSLGSYRLRLDKKSPSVSMQFDSRSKKLNLSLSDNMSGIDSLSVEVDGQWLRMAHNSSLSRAWGDVNELELDKGQHRFTVYAVDQAGNEVKEIRVFEF